MQQCCIDTIVCMTRMGYSYTAFFDQWSVFLDNAMLDIHDVIITSDLNFHLDISTQLDMQLFPRHSATVE